MNCALSRPFAYTSSKSVRLPLVHANKDFLDKYTRNVNHEAKLGRFDRIVGRKREIEQLYHVLLKRTKRNAILVGDAGVGKTALVEELARSIVTNEKDVPHELTDMEVLELDISGIIAGTSMRGELEERVMQILKSVVAQENVILFIDEIHTLVSASTSKSSSGEINICEMMKPMLARGQLQCIGATTREEYVKYFQRDSAFDRRFQYVNVAEPTIADTMQMMSAIKKGYEEFHKCTITNEAIEVAVVLSEQYVPYRNFPDKAIDLIDEACSRVRIEAKGEVDKSIVQGHDIEKVISRMVDMDLKKIHHTEKQKLDELEHKLFRQIIGQSNAIMTVMQTIRRYTCGLHATNRPICSMLFVGPTGVGKTHLCKLIAKEYYGNENKCIRFDMSEYMEEFSVSTLIGSPPGYVGYTEGGKLTEAVKRNPCSVFLFDEIEKAHHDVLNLLLQILNDGALTDSFGKTYSFKNTMIVMTSNSIGDKQHNRIGFSEHDDTLVAGQSISIQSHATTNTDALKTAFRPEFLNRIDQLIYFNELNKTHLYAILNLEIQEALSRVPPEVQVIVSRCTKKKIVNLAATQTHYGARPIRRLVEEHVVDVLTNTLLGQHDIGHVIVI